MKSRLPTITSLQRALVALSFLALPCCALDASEDDLLADDSMSGDIASPDDDEMAPGETMPEDETVTDETATDETAADEEDEVFGDEGTAAACVPYGRRCGGGASCCAGLRCSFDGYIAYCRH